MVKKGIYLFALLAVVVLSATIYWFYFSNPASFLKNEQLIEEMNRVFPEADVNIIQDTIPIDERHWVVPFVAEGGRYGFSNWEWQRHKWDIVSIDTSGQPHVWKINSDESSTFQLVWNLHPDDQVGFLTFYLIKDRRFYSSDGQETYDPRIQMAKKVALHGKSYGVLRLPDDWVTFMNAYKKVETAKNPDVFFGNLSLEQAMYFGWTSYDKLEKETLPNSSFNEGFSRGNGDMDSVMYLTESEIETPEDKK